MQIYQHFCFYQSLLPVFVVFAVSPSVFEPILNLGEIGDLSVKNLWGIGKCFC